MRVPLLRGAYGKILHRATINPLLASCDGRPSINVRLIPLEIILCYEGWSRVTVYVTHGDLMGFVSSICIQ